jgi:hypothetical protein
MKQFLTHLAVLTALTACPTEANDSSAAIGLGGLELTRNEAISMDSEELYLSLDVVRVKYRFTNHSDQDVETLVSFPLPAIPDGIEGYLGDTSYPEWQEREFRTWVDGKSVTLDYREVVTANGKNVEARLQQLGWPVKFWSDYEFTRKIEQMPEAEKAQYLTEGLLKKPVPEADWTVPGWQVATQVTRTQNFPAGKTVTVEHSYKPIAGGSVGGMLDMVAQGKKESFVKEYAANYCIDDAFVQGFSNKRRAKIQKATAENTDEGLFYVEYWLDYVLKSGANWHGPIKDFRMVVDKGRADNLISLCADGVKKINATQFEVRKTNFEPKDDVEILIVSWPKNE